MGVELGDGVGVDPPPPKITTAVLEQVEVPASHTWYV